MTLNIIKKYTCTNSNFIKRKYFNNDKNKIEKRINKSTKAKNIYIKDPAVNWLVASK